MRPTGSIRARGPNSFEIRYATANDKLTGKRTRTYKTFNGTYDEAKKELRKILTSLDTGEHVQPPKLKTGDYLIQWLDAIRSHVSPKTFERYSEIAHYYLVPAFILCPLNHLNPVMIQAA